MIIIFNQHENQHEISLSIWTIMLIIKERLLITVQSKYTKSHSHPIYCSQIFISLKNKIKIKVNARTEKMANKCLVLRKLKYLSS